MKKILPLFFFLISFCILNAQIPEWITYTSSGSGLPGDNIRSLATDGLGNNWIGTSYTGLAKFDGTNWSVYNTSNSGIPSNSVWSIAIDNSGDKWFGFYSGGLAKFDDTNWTAYNVSNSGLPHDIVYSLAIDGSGNKWIGTLGGGLAKFDGTTWTVYNTSNSDLPNDVIYSIAIDGAGNKWIGTDGGGLAKFDDTNWTVYNTSNSGMHWNEIWSIAIDSSGNKWVGVGTYGHELAKFDGSTWTIYNSTNSGMPDAVVRSIVIDDSGNKWIGTSGGGLIKFDDTTWMAYTTSNSGLLSSDLYSVVIDSLGNKWIGTFNNGLAVYKEGGVVMPAAQALNGEFDNGTDGWNISTYDPGAMATMSIDTNAVISGRNSCAVSISQATGTDWHIQLWQNLFVYPGHTYTINFKARASSDKTITLAVQKSTSPHTTYLYSTHALTTSVQTFTDEVTINTADLAKLQFYLGSSTDSVWIDAVSIVDSVSSINGLDEHSGTAKNFILQQNYPNPFSSLTTIKYKAREPGFVSIKIFDQMGREVATLVNEQKPRGEYSIVWNATGLAEGIYFCRLQAGLFSETRKLVLQR